MTGGKFWYDKGTFLFSGGVSGKNHQNKEKDVFSMPFTKDSRKLHFAGRVISLLLALCMTMTLWPMAAFADVPANVTFQVRYSNNASGTVSYRFGDTGGFTDITGTDTQSVDVPTGATSITIKAAATEGYYIHQGNSGVYTGGQRTTEFDFTKLTGDGFTYTLPTDNTVPQFQIEFDNNSGTGGEGGNNGGNNGGGNNQESDKPSHPGYENGEPTTSTVIVTGQADFYINDSKMVNLEGTNSSFSNLDYHYDGNGYVDFYFNCFINQRITELEINGQNCFDDLPTPYTDEGKAALLAACKGQLYEFKITVPYSDTYNIVSSIKDLDDTDREYMVVGNFLWTYTNANQGDDYIDHGRMELVSVKYGNETYTREQLNNPGTNFNWSQDENGGSAVLPTGAVVTVRLVPDYGYQLTSFGINGGTFGTGDEQSTFTFEIKSGNAHLGAHFTAVADKVTSNTEAVKDGSITLGEGEIDTGSVVLSVDNAQNANEGEFQNAVEQNTGTPGYEVASVVDINLNQVVYKGTTNEDDVWKTEMNTLKSDAEITLNVGGGYNDPVVIHEKHDGSYEVLDTTYNAEEGTITFQTDSFSHYAIAVKNACEASLQGLTDEMLSSLLSEQEKERVRNGESVKVWLTAADLTDPLPTDEQNLIDSAKGNATVGLYLDICLMKQIGITPRDHIIETGTPVTVTLRVPDSLINTNAAVTRTYQIIRLHDDMGNKTVTVLPCTYDPATKTLSFQSSQFSIYALAYVDQQPPAQDSHPDSDTPEATPAPTPVKRSTIPQTGDAGAPALWFLLALAGGLGMVWCGKKRFRRQ